MTELFPTATAADTINNNNNRHKQQQQQQPPLPTDNSAGAAASSDVVGMTVEFSSEDFRRCRIINASALDPYVEDQALVHKRDLSLVAFGSAHRHWADTMHVIYMEASGAAAAAAAAASSSGATGATAAASSTAAAVAMSGVAARMSLAPEALQVQSVFMSKILPSMEALWQHFKNNTAHVTTIVGATCGGISGNGAAGLSYGNGADSWEQAVHQRTIRTFATPEDYVKLFSRLRDYSEFDFLRLILDTRSELLLKAATASVGQQQQQKNK